MKELYRGFAHLAVSTRDIDASIAFYQRLGGTLQQRDTLPTPEGEKLLALVEFAGFLLEFIQSPTPEPMGDGVLPHFAVYVDDVDQAAEALRSAGVTTFLKPEKTVLPGLFGGLENRFFTGPSGEQIELLHML